MENWSRSLVKRYSELQDELKTEIDYFKEQLACHWTNEEESSPQAFSREWLGPVLSLHRDISMDAFRLSTAMREVGTVLRIAAGIEAPSSIPDGVPDFLRKVGLPVVSLPHPSYMSGVYFLVHSNEIVYVGQSVNVVSRVQSHCNSDKVFDSVYVIPCDKSRLDFLERHFIIALQPPLNRK